MHGVCHIQCLRREHTPQHAHDGTDSDRHAERCVHTSTDIRAVSCAVVRVVSCAVVSTASCAVVCAASRAAARTVSRTAVRAVSRTVVRVVSRAVSRAFFFSIDHLLRGAITP